MSEPTRYGWCMHGMKPNPNANGPTRYVNEHDHDRIVAALRAERDKALAILWKASEWLPDTDRPTPPLRRLRAEIDELRRGRCLPHIRKQEG